MEAVYPAPSTSSEYDSAKPDGFFSALIEPEILLPSQFYDRCRGRSILEGERRLMLAVLEDGIMCYQRYAGATRPRSRRMFQEAETWLFRDRDASWPFSFESICAVFDLNPTYLRERLLRWREQTSCIAPEQRARVARVRLRAARRHKILPFVPRRRHRAKTAAVAA